MKDDAEINEQVIKSFFDSANKNNGWADQADLGNYLSRDKSIDYKARGYRLSEIIKNFRYLIEYKDNNSTQVPILIRLKNTSDEIEKNNIQIVNQSTKITDRVRNVIEVKNKAKYIGETNPDILEEAARRHLQSCKYMVEHIEELENAKDIQQKNILNNIYYLSGYIFECISNYAIFELKVDHIYLDREKIQGKPNLYRIKHNYRQSFQGLSKELDSFDIDSILKNKACEKLFDNWSTNSRYRADDSIDKHQIAELIDVAKTIVNEIKSELEGK